MFRRRRFVIVTALLAIAATPAIAQIAAPAGDTGLWAAINPTLAEGLGAAVTALFGWAVTLFATHTGIKIRADREAQLRETLKTGLFQAAHELELVIDKRWTPEQRQSVVDGMVSWAQDRAATQLRKLGLPEFVVEAMARKVLSGALGEIPGFEIDETTVSGNPGETPALDRAAGGNGGN